MKWITLPERATKPRDRGLSIVIDNGTPTAFFTDVVESHGDLIDYVKFGWGTALVTRDLAAKVAALRAAGIGFFFGGTLFEKALYQGKLREYRAFCENLGCRHVEISNGTLDLDNAAKARYIAEWSRDFLVFSEVGFKDVQRSQDLYPGQWIEYIRQDRDAGAFKIITEARESGTSGICRADGELRYGLIAEILDSGLDPNDLVFEAPNKALQAYFVTRMGPDVVPLEPSGSACAPTPSTPPRPSRPGRCRCPVLPRGHRPGIRRCAGQGDSPAGYTAVAREEAGRPAPALPPVRRRPVRSPGAC